MNPRNLTTALMVMAHTQDMDMDIAPSHDQHTAAPRNLSELLTQIEMSGSWLARQAARYSASRRYGHDDDVYALRDRERLEDALAEMELLVRTYRNA